jgi:hypothetical protein
MQKNHGEVYEVDFTNPPSFTKKFDIDLKMETESKSEFLDNPEVQIGMFNYDGNIQIYGNIVRNVDQKVTNEAKIIDSSGIDFDQIKGSYRFAESRNHSMTVAYPNQLSTRLQRNFIYRLDDNMKIVQKYNLDFNLQQVELWVYGNAMIVLEENSRRFRYVPIFDNSHDQPVIDAKNDYPFVRRFYPIGCEYIQEFALSHNMP